MWLMSDDFNPFSMAREKLFLYRKITMCIHPRKICPDGTYASDRMRSKLINMLIGLRKICWECRQFTWPEQPVTINYFNNIKFKLYPEGQVARLAYVYYLERKFLRFALNYVKPGMIAVDVGANIGLWSICLAKQVGNGGKVHSFEPYKKTVGILKRNIDLNQLKSKVVVHQEALGRQSSDGILIMPEFGGDADCFVKSSNADDSSLNCSDQKILISTLDEWAKRYNIIDGIHFAKIDCEGSELFVLQGAQELLARSKQLLIVCECNPEATIRQGYQPSELFSFLEQFGFNVGLIDPRTKLINYHIPPSGFCGNFIAMKES